MTGTEKLRIAVLANPNASGIAALGSAIAAFVDLQHDVDVSFTESVEDLHERIRVLDPNIVDVVALAGGDGTLSSAASLLSSRNLPLLVLPVGTANDFARSLNIPNNVADAALLVGTGSHNKVDVGLATVGEDQTTKRTFLNAVSLGLSAAVSQAQDDQLKGVFGGLSYALTTLQNISGLETFEAELELDGEVLTITATQITIGNGVFFGGGLRISDDSSLQSGLLHGYVIGDISPAKLITLGPRVKLGNLDDHPEITKFTAKRIFIRCKRPQLINVDGDIFGETPLELSAQSSALTVICGEPE